VYYGGVVSKGRGQSVWTCHIFDVTAFGPAFENAGASVGVAPPCNVAQTNVGLFAQFTFTCSASGELELGHGLGETMLVDPFAIPYGEEGTDILTIGCGATATPTALPAPGDSDGDGCTDAQENGTNELLGGRRRYLNPHDYFNPTHDGENRVDDILAVVDQYYVDQGEPGYTQETDRTLIGPNAWNLGAPDGLQRVDDILNIVKQYAHDCA